jgi:peptidyl-prolyl cis-trans isomerase D
VNDDVVAGELAKVAAFQGTAGTFDRETYGQTLKQNGTSEADFEAGLRRDVARQLLQGSVSGGFAAPAPLTDTLFAWAGEKRGFSILRLTEADLVAPVPGATDADIQAYYDANIALYTRPEAKRISYAALLPETVGPTVEIAEDAVKQAYDARLADFVIPEKRLVERLAFGTEAEAIAAKARLDAGESFDALVTERNLTLDDVDMGDVSAAELGAAGAAVFALAEPGVVGPFASDLGPALFRMNAVLAAQETTYEQARPDLLLELQMEAARKAIADKVEAVDDALAGGASLQEISTDHGMTLATTDYAPGAEDNDPIAGYAEFRDAAENIGEGDFPEALILADGGLISLQLLETVAPTPVPLDQIKDKVAEGWRAAALTKAFAEKGQAVKADVEAGAALGAQGIVDRTAAMDRQGNLADAPPSVLKAVFEMAPGDVRVIEEPGFAAVLQLDTVTPATTEGEDATAMRDAIDGEIRKAVAEDVFSLFTGALTAEAGITLDQTAVNAVNAQLGN